MNFSINMITVIQSVLLAALIGVTDVEKKEVNIDKPSDDSIIIEIPTEAKPKDIKAIGYDDLCDQIEDLTKKIERLETGVSKAKRRSGFVFLLLIAFSGAAIFYYRKELDLQSNRDKEQNKKIEQLQMDLKRNLNSTTDEIRSQLKKIELDAKDLKNSNGSDNNQGTQKNVTNNQHSASQQSSHQSTQKNNQKTYKYFMLQETGGKLFVSERHLKDNPIGWFCMEIVGDKAQYVVNPQLSSQILEDIPTLKIFTKNFEIKGNASSIKTTKPGRMERKGNEWVVTDKVSIELN